ncbi:hypothetical protein CEXT_773481 [Caerostris extrusa]|uniref:Uncharacterized protein n=1 Tax=Caerostris extrusa TaxID=172846 RepID=A0AAV4PFE8_CAEEX|nr:hypothetical protein CEXT_773481 [Caerostris extrusa]
MYTTNFFNTPLKTFLETPENPQIPNQHNLLYLPQQLNSPPHHEDEVNVTKDSPVKTNTIQSPITKQTWKPCTKRHAQTRGTS